MTLWTVTTTLRTFTVEAFGIGEAIERALQAFDLGRETITLVAA